MDGIELFNSLRTLLACYDALLPGSPIMREVVMWREKFLEIQPKLDDIEQAEYAWKVFLGKNCQELVTKSPEKLYKEIADEYVNKVKDEAESPRDT